jgi:hypothetical protein
MGTRIHLLAAISLVLAVFSLLRASPVHAGEPEAAPAREESSLLAASSLFTEPVTLSTFSLAPGSLPGTTGSLLSTLGAEEAGAKDNRRPFLEVFGFTHFRWLGGFVSARENAIPGDRFGFKKLDADFGYNAGAGVRLNPGPEDTLEATGSYFYLRGDTTLDSDRTFNQTTFLGGTTLETRPDWIELRFNYLRRLLGAPESGGSLWFLFGIDYHYINWKFRGTISPASVGSEQNEDFYRQTFPLPVFGLRYLVDLGPWFSIDLRGDAFRANHWRHWNDEGGAVYTSSTIINGTGTLRWHPAPWFFVEGGYAYNYYTLDEKSPEDGNRLLARTHGPVAAVGLSF